MAKFTSRFPELGFYVGDDLRKFSAGTYVTDNKEEIETIEKLSDAERVEEPKAEEPKQATKPKAPAKKSSGK